MARTLNATAHAVRRDTFVDAATRLMQSRGYESLSIQDVLDETGASKGAFYHYFDSKEALLEAIIDRIVVAALEAVEPITLASDKTAVEKLVGMFSGISGWKTARKELMLAILQVWMSDDNIVVREKFRGSMAPQLRPLLTQIVAEGKSQGLFDVDDPASTADIVVGLIAWANESASRLFLNCQSGSGTVAEVRRLGDAFQQALERVLGAPRGSLSYIDEETIQFWFG